MPADNPSNAAHGDHLIALSALALPLANVGLFFTIRHTGGAHGHGPVIAGTIVAAETALISWFCARKTKRRRLAWSAIGALLNIAVSVVGIYLIIFVVLAAGNWGGGGD